MQYIPSQGAMDYTLTARDYWIPCLEPRRLADSLTHSPGDRSLGVCGIRVTVTPADVDCGPNRHIQSAPVLSKNHIHNSYLTHHAPCFLVILVPYTQSPCLSSSRLLTVILSTMRSTHTALLAKSSTFHSLVMQRGTQFSITTHERMT